MMKVQRVAIQNTDCDQDSDVCFVKETDEEIDTAEIQEEEWIEYMKRSTATAIERMKAAKIQCWIETHRRMKWRLTLRNASFPDERWAKKAAQWNPGLSIKHQTYRPVGRPKKRWADATESEDLAVVFQVTSLNLDEFVTAYACCCFFYTRDSLCTVSHRAPRVLLAC